MSIHPEGRECAVPGCITLLRSDRPLDDPTCTACKTRPPCRVCAGRGTTGKDQHASCYRCEGSGKQPDSLLYLRRQTIEWRRQRAA